MSEGARRQRWHAGYHGAGAHFAWPPITPNTIKAVLDQMKTSVSIYDRSGVIAELEDALKDYFGVSLRYSPAPEPRRSTRPTRPLTSSPVTR